MRGALALLNALPSKDAAAEALGLCAPLPAYLASPSLSLEGFLQELNMVFMYTFADLNMANLVLVACVEVLTAVLQGNKKQTRATH